MPKRYSKAARKMVYAALVSRDGEQCRLCRKAPPETRLEIDHQDGVQDREDTLEDLRLLCVACNRKTQFSHRVPPSVSTLLTNRQTNRQTPQHNARLPVRQPANATNSVKAGNTDLNHPPQAARPPRDTTEARKGEIDYSRGPAQMQANNLYENAFRRFVQARVTTQEE